MTGNTNLADAKIGNLYELDYANAVTITDNTYTPTKNGYLFIYGTTRGSDGYMGITDNALATIAVATFPGSGTAIGCNAIAQKGRTYSFGSYNASLTKKFVPFK